MHGDWDCSTMSPRREVPTVYWQAIVAQTRVYPYPLGAGSARPNPKMGASDPENPLFLGFSVLRGGLRPWSQTMVSEGARPWVRGRSGDWQAIVAHIWLPLNKEGCDPSIPTEEFLGPKGPGTPLWGLKGRKRRGCHIV